MTFKTAILILLSSVTILEPYSNEFLNKQTLFGRAAGAIGQSRLAHLFEKYIQSKISMKVDGLSDEEVSKEYRELLEEAHRTLEIPEERCVPGKKIRPGSLAARFAAGLAYPNAIYVNEEKLNERMYGARRCGLLHEDVHKKYNDMSMDTIVELLTLIISAIGVHKLIKYVKPSGRFKIVHSIFVLAAGLSAGGFSSMKYRNFFERRADIVGHYAAQCSACVQEAADERRKIFEEGHVLRNNGYLWADELEEIARDLEEQNKLCVHHRGEV